MRTLHLVSHTHWDREWYLTFQQFRLKLVYMLDQLLDLLESNPEFKHFMLDGQTIILDDYLEMRPEREAQIRQLVKEGRLLVGPWYILPDEFLVSPEAIIRNLLEGQRRARDFGGAMPVGYLPDPFGHIGQMPQILRGFGLESACLQRGVGDEPLEFWWQAPDGSKVFVTYLWNGYGNAVGLPTSLPLTFASEIIRRRDDLLPHSPSGEHILLMHGNDHWTADKKIGEAITYVNRHPELMDGDLLIHSTLPAYLAAVKPVNMDLKTLTGELRSSRRHNLLPGVLSTRIWIKLRNHECQALLEKWVEPFSAIANIVGLPPSGIERLSHPASLVRKAWQYLLECHPHDSICGCSIDQVHEEMRPRFDQAHQIGNELIQQNLASLAASVHTYTLQNPAGAGVFATVVVFNPHSQSSTDQVKVELELLESQLGFEILDENGHVLPHQILDLQVQDLLTLNLDRQAFKNLFRQMQVGRVNGLLANHLTIHREGKRAFIEVVMSENVLPEPDTWVHQQSLVEALLDDPSLETFHLKARSPQLVKLVFLAQDVPGIGYRSFWIRKRKAKRKKREPARLSYHPRSYFMENKFLAVQALPDDGTISITHKASGRIFHGLNRFVDGGDRGDEYNYSPPPTDNLIQNGDITSINLYKGPVWQAIEINIEKLVPCALTADRQARSTKLVNLPITTRLTLTEGVPRLDFQTWVDNQALDHRLRVHFPLPFLPEKAFYDGHFELVERPMELPLFDHTWPEQPRPEMPQRTFTAAEGQGIQFILANRGLPEIQVTKFSGGGELALTLLRCVGWLSRDDIPERVGPAGPILPTPGAQLPGMHTFDYSIIISDSGDQRAYHQAWVFNTPLRAAQTGLHPGVLLSHSSFLEVQPVEFLISAIKMAEDGTGLLVRGYNFSSKDIDVYLKPWHSFSRVIRTNLAEEGGDELEQGADGVVRFFARAHEIVTIKFSINSEQIFR
jgi:mannosylglycerate hydrolase